MITNHVTVTVPVDGVAFGSEDVFINETSTEYDAPRMIILSNKEDHNMIVKVLDKGEDASTMSGFFLKSGSQLQLMDTGSAYSVSARFENTQASTGELIVSCFHYNESKIF